MNCPACKSATKVTDSRELENAREIRRRRQCEICWYKFTTYERPEITRFMVSKSSWEKQLYDRDKLIKSILKAIKKTDVNYQDIHRIVSDLELTRMTNKIWVSSKRIWKDVMESLKNISKVAAIRYASVYLWFEQADDFVEFINTEIK